MKVSGQHELSVARHRVWDALQDPDVLVRTLPGCQSLERTAPDEYAITIKAGVASIRGLYAGKVAMSGQEPPIGYTLVASGQGAPGTVEATARVMLDDSPSGGTIVRYDADAMVGGMVGGVGQRVLTTVARSMADEFFRAVEVHLREGARMPAPPVEAEPAPAGAPAPGGIGEVFRAPAEQRATADARALLLAALAGAAIALLGVVVGRRTRGS